MYISVFGHRSLFVLDFLSSLTIPLLLFLSASIYQFSDIVPYLYWAFCSPLPFLCYYFSLLLLLLYTSVFGPCSFLVLDFLFSLTIPLLLFLSATVTIVSISFWTLFSICIGHFVFSYRSSVTIYLCYCCYSIHKYLDVLDLLFSLTVPLLLFLSDTVTIVYISFRPYVPYLYWTFWFWVCFDIKRLRSFILFSAFQWKFYGVIACKAISSPLPILVVNFHSWNHVWVLTRWSGSSRCRN